MDIKIPREEKCDTCHGQVQNLERKQKHVHIVMDSGQLNMEQNTPFGKSGQSPSMSLL